MKAAATQPHTPASLSVSPPWTAARKAPQKAFPHPARRSADHMSPGITFQAMPTTRQAAAAAPDKCQEAAHPSPSSTKIFRKSVETLNATSMDSSAWILGKQGGIIFNAVKWLGQQKVGANWQWPPFSAASKPACIMQWSYRDASRAWQRWRGEAHPSRPPPGTPPLPARGARGGRPPGPPPPRPRRTSPPPAAQHWIRGATSHLRVFPRSFHCTKG